MGSQRELKVRAEPRADRVGQVFLAISDHGEGESIYTIFGPDNQKIPLVALDEAALAVLKRYSQAAANESGRTIRIVTFTRSSLYDTVSPSTTGDQ